MSAVLNWLGDLLTNIFSFVLNILPDSPFIFLAADAEISKFLGYVNYFIPINSMIAILVPWLSCVAIYYAVSTILRWAKAVE